MNDNNVSKILVETAKPGVKKSNFSFSFLSPSKALTFLNKLALNQKIKVEKQSITSTSLGKRDVLQIDITASRVQRARL